MTDYRYPNHLTFMWKRSDNDWEVVATLNGTTFEDDFYWNDLVERTWAFFVQFSGHEVRVFNREDVSSVLVINPTELGEEVPLEE